MNRFTEMHPRVDCWVCGETDTLHEHHVIPRSSGGTNGQLVTLCSTCHGIVHSAALNKNFILDPTPVIMPLCSDTRASVDCVKKLVYLTNIVFKSSRLTKNDVNKTLTFSTKLEPEYVAMLKSICNRYGVTQQKAIRLALRHLSVAK
jgi:hypothetical protein